MEKSTFGERLTQIIEEQTLSRKEIAYRAEISVQAIGNYIKGNRKPDYDVIARLSKALNVSSDWLIGLSDVKSPDSSIQGACHTIGISESAVTNLQAAISNDPYEIINSLLECSLFYDAISSAQKAIEVHESGLIRFSKELTAQIMELFGVVPGKNLESGFSNVQQHSDEEFDGAIRMLAELAPNMTVLSRKDASRHHLLTAVDYLQKAMAEIVGDI